MSNRGVGELGRLMAGERLLIDRRRRGETQAQAARRYFVSRARYGMWERGDEHPQPPRVGRLASHERCFLYRRRVGETQLEVAEALGTCRWTINQMEHGIVKCDDLLWYWEQ